MPVPENRSIPPRVWLFAALALATAVVVVIGPALFDRFTLNVLTRSMIYAMLAVTVDILWGYTGILTFGQAAFFGTGAYASAMVLSHLGSTPALLALALALAVIVPVLLGGFVGWLSFGHGSTPLYATVISLVVPIVVMQLVFSGGVWTGSSSGLVGYSGLPLGLPGYFRLTGICLIVTTVVAQVFTRSDAGKLLVAIRDNEARCAYLGLDPQRLKIVLTALLAGVAGIAGFLYANASGVVAPENTGFVFGTEIVIWTALGGRGTIIGPVMGAIGIDYLSAQLSGDLPFLWNLVVGTLFVVMIILLPNGLAQLARMALPRRNRQQANAAGSPAITVAPAGNGSTGDNRVLSVSGLGKSFGSLQVLQDIDLDVSPGELVSLVGPNGAGKTTLMRCLSDGTEATTGSVSIAGQNIDGMTPDKIVTLGVGRKFQVASVFDSLTVADCLRTARASRQAPSLLRRSATLGLPAAAADILRSTGLDRMLGQPVSLLSHGQKQSLELAMVVALEPKLILLDEPTAGLTNVERTTIGATLQKLTGELGFAAILVEHDLDFVRDISTRIVVLHQGKLVLDGSVADVVNSETVRTIYSGAAHA
ncbi:ATP-binding cassette domain-containing protein [Mesorhizobium sp. CA18]|uniref:branched-chain amino acid ABC transporter ATP-binding protein/permease n=1 Tax=unclassified Mesorhizobium TaxID=325217 RepID=UPI001CCBC238|nr:MULTISPECIES: ATP-binding cassette domain-containing protein [unclassified Mesorhizobium]MBZ9734513.1 ATP-binding cassette domain-containing protein [Mesorhizobium sp. CA9]MBZ9826951.1 ATP-binding cassette domain-containing protein [Mesorhizobium sp. CA18]MBZ9832427.1 ATP-binding cassette domain-containing protein [Mesorhizobium sp. CA2]MBZ9838517.1 ATP-binding cassette domain-containing protein [Mesorhizobium sp. CA3]MBZ9878924.1 ATP-binding cassette domain-containing protein [Mesorhizobiu